MLVQRMAPQGVELAFGCVQDPSFGPLVMVAAGGLLVEMLSDRRFAPAPLGEREALRVVEGLKVDRLLDGVRGETPANKSALARALSNFSVLCTELSDVIAEIDVNPVIANADGVLAVDALVVPKNP